MMAVPSLEREGTVHEEDDDNAQQHLPAFPGIMLHQDSFVEFLVSRNEVVQSARLVHPAADDDDDGDGNRDEQADRRKSRKKHGKRRRRDKEGGDTSPGTARSSRTPRHRRRRKSESLGSKHHTSSSTSKLTGTTSNSSAPMRSRRRLIMSTTLAKTDLIVVDQQRDHVEDQENASSKNTLSEARVMVEMRTTVMEVEALRKLVANDARGNSVRSQASVVSGRLQPLAVHVATTFDVPDYADYLRALDAELVRVAVASDLPVTQRLQLFGEVQQQLASTFARILILQQRSNSQATIAL